MLFVKPTAADHALVYNLEELKNFLFCKDTCRKGKQDFYVSSSIDDVVETFHDDIVYSILRQRQKPILLLLP